MKLAMLAENENINIQFDDPDNMVGQNAGYVGLIVTNRAVSAGCLLDDGTFLTTLHAIFDIQGAIASRASRNPQEFYDDIAQAKIWFVKNNEIFVYGISSILHDGVTLLNQDQRMQTTNFDFARLKLDEDATKDLGRGFSLDPFDHFGFGGSEPNQYIMIAPPIINESKGKYYCQRNATLAQLEQGRYFTFPQFSNQPTSPGNSGSAVLPLGGQYNYPNSNLYAIHSQRSSLGQEGLKISMYRLNVASTQTQAASSHQRASSLGTSSASSAYGSFWSSAHMLHLNFEALERNADVSMSEIENFLTNLSQMLKTSQKGQGNKGKASASKDKLEIPESLRGKVVEFHGTRKHSAIKGEGSGFYEMIGGGNNQVHNCLAKCVNEIVLEYYRHNSEQLVEDYYKKIRKPLPNDWKKEEAEKETYSKAVQSSVNFVVDIGFDVGIDKATKKDTSWIYIENVGCDEYHIYPCDPSAKKTCIEIDAWKVLDKAQKEAKTSWEKFFNKFVK